MRGELRRAFTLIELLVTIAIISILAAILFPAFAAARRSARATTSSSNIRQLSIGVLVYTQDCDDHFPLSFVWRKDSPVCLAACTGSNAYSTWGYDIAPYLKSFGLFADPLAGQPLPVGLTNANLWPTFTQYGYNYTALSPVTQEAVLPNNPSSVALASVARSDSLIMLAGRSSSQDEGEGYVEYANSAGGLTDLAVVDPPACSDARALNISYCFNNWGLGGIQMTTEGMTSANAGYNTGWVAFRNADQGTFAFVDGHVKSMTAGQAAAGTNWTSTSTVTSVQITDRSLYHWELQP